ncbi:thiolase family protein [[Mycobacterium] nativiensis]|uniref:Thiolase family protein n=1 Tax=[Mycobacterium] nativiensis TaxID=2855503 RepID=A0ABU5XUN2_9MYCO|nr:thiolase family protein [Mycolicibacter sp. MYC340]MEB3031206.1 thiolase family protein [Mycolicibacter sp. MYC340]
MRDVVIVDAVRTAIGKRGGALADAHPVDLSADVLTALADRTGLDPAVVDDVIWGCVSQVGDQSSNIARFAVLAAGWPVGIPGTTVNRACGSSQQAVDFAAHAIAAGAYDIAVAGGVESMSRLPLGVTRQSGFPYGPRVMRRFDDFSFNQGLSAEAVAAKWGLGRADLDRFASTSHERAARAIDSGAFEHQIVAITTAAGAFAADEGLRRGTTPETLAKLTPSFTEYGVIHAGNSSQVSDGAAALLLTTPEKARELGLAPMARYRGGAVAGADPVLMLTAPIPATEAVLRRTGIGIDEIGVFEVNEAFASVPLAWTAELGADPERVNPLGGAIAVGHPLGASGAILMTRMVHHMRDRGLRYGLQTMCEGGGTANATIVELIG